MESAFGKETSNQMNDNNDNNNVECNIIEGNGERATYSRFLVADRPKRYIPLSCVLDQQQLKGLRQYALGQAPAKAREL
jgi:hypothetical protein